MREEKNQNILRRLAAALSLLLVLGNMSACGQPSDRTGAGFEKLGFVCNVEENIEYDYVSCLTDDTSKEVKMKAVFSDYERYPHPEKEGYELRNVNLTLTLENVKENATAANCCTAYVDYYLLDAKTERTGGAGDSASGTETVWVDGKEYGISYSFKMTELTFSEDGNTGIMKFAFEYEVPADYDGVVIALYNYANSSKGTHVVENYDKDTLFFRLYNKETAASLSPEEIIGVTPKGEKVHVESEYMKYDMFVHEHKYISADDSLAEAFFYIPEGETVTREDIAGIWYIDDYYDESQEYGSTKAGELFTLYVMNGMVELEHLTEEYMWDTYEECFNTMSYHELCTFIEEAGETSEEIVKKYACEHIKLLTEGYIWSK